MTAIRISPRPGLFSISDYPNTTTGDDATGLRAAFAACVAAGGGVVQLENRVYTLNSPDAAYGSNGPCLVNGDNRGFPIDIRGRGRGVTTLKYGAHVSTLVGFNMLTTHPILSPVNLYDMTLDGQTANTTLQGYIYHYSATASMLNEFETTGIHHCERVDAFGFGHSESSVRFAIRMSVNRTDLATAQAAPMCIVRGLRVRDCDWGHGAGTTTTRGGGVGGIYLGGLVSSGNKASELYNQVYNQAHYQCDDIIVDGLKHTSGRSPLSVSAPGAPIQLGGDGVCTNIRIRGLVCENSGDIGIELDNPINALIEGCTFINGDGWGVLLLATSANAPPGSDEWQTLVRDCEVIYPLVDNYGNAGGGSPGGGAFSSNGRFGCWFNGKMTWENINTRYEDIVDVATTLISLGPAREQIIRNCSVEMLGPSPTNGTLNMLRVNAVGRPQKVVVENFRGRRNTPISTNITAADTVFNVLSANDLDLRVKGISYSSAGLQTNSGKRNVKMLDLSCTGFNPTDTWSTDLLSSTVIFESGTASNYTYDGTSPKTYSAAANLSTENRALYVATQTDTSSNNVVGVVKDGATYMLMKTGASLAGYKSGMFCARRDSTSRIEGYIYDSGTNTYMCLDKVTSGTRAPLLPAAGGTATGAVNGGDLVTDTISSPPSGISTVGLIVTRIGTAVTHYPSIIIQGDTVTFEHWVSAEPGSSTSTQPASTGDAWCQATLTGTDVHAFGSRAVGEQGFIQLPIDAGAKIGKLLHRRLNVMSGRIEGVYVGMLEESASASTGFSYNPTQATKARIDGTLELVSSNFANMLSASATPVNTQFVASSTAFQQNLIRRGNSWPIAIADTAVVFVSTTPWQNQTGSWGTLTVQGGTVTKIEVSKDGTTYRDTGVIAGAIPVQPNWYVKVTHTGAPTAIFMQED